MTIPSYPKVYAIGHRAVEDLFKEEVQITEKIDGSQFSFAKINGELLLRSKGAIIHVDNPEKMFSVAVETVKSIADKLHDGWFYRGEYLRSPKHNTLVYDRIPKLNIILFDVTVGEEAYLSYEELLAEANRLGLEVVPLIYTGKVDTADSLLELLNRESILGKQKIEGIVAKNYLRFGIDGRVLMGKYVREDFKELNNRNWRVENPTKGDVIAEIIASLKTQARWEKGVYHLRDKGLLDNSPKDIGNLLKEIQEDIKAEEGQFIKNRLYAAFIKDILRGTTAGVPEWYKERLLKEQFEESKCSQ